jgi:hypothetical protein
MSNVNKPDVSVTSKPPAHYQMHFKLESELHDLGAGAQTWGYVGPNAIPFFGSDRFGKYTVVKNFTIYFIGIDVFYVDNPYNNNIWFQVSYHPFNLNDAKELLAKTLYVTVNGQRYELPPTGDGSLDTNTQLVVAYNTGDAEKLAPVLRTVGYTIDYYLSWGS